MARAIVSYHYSTGESLVCEVSADSEHPDVLDEIATRARKLYGEVLADMREAEDAGPE